MRYRCSVKTYILTTFWSNIPALVTVLLSPGASSYKFLAGSAAAALVINVWNRLFTVETSRAGLVLGRIKRTILWCEIQSVSWDFAESGALWAMLLTTKNGTSHHVPLLLFSEKDVGSIVEDLLSARADLRLPLLRATSQND